LYRDAAIEAWVAGTDQHCVDRHQIGALTETREKQHYNVRMRWTHAWSIISRHWAIASWIVAALALLYYGPKRISETYYWWWDHISDDKVLAEVRKKIFTHRLDFVN
jgi:hypothetical protein